MTAPYRKAPNYPATMARKAKHERPDFTIRRVTAQALLNALRASYEASCP